MPEVFNGNCSVCGGDHLMETCPKKGLGGEKNAMIAELLLAGNYDGLLELIDRESDKNTACDVVCRSMLDFNKSGRANSVDELIRSSLSDIDKHGPALKALILYTWRNHLRGERFWKHPSKDETLFIDDDGEVISFQGEIGTFSEGMNYIKTLGKYEVLTGPNKGRIFDGGYEASKRNDPSYRPIKGPSMEK